MPLVDGAGRQKKRIDKVLGANVHERAGLGELGVPIQLGGFLAIISIVTTLDQSAEVRRIDEKLEPLAVRRHLRDIGTQDRSLDVQSDSARSLEKQPSLSCPVLAPFTLVRSFDGLELKVDAENEGSDLRPLIDIGNELLERRRPRGREERNDIDLLGDTRAEPDCQQDNKDPVRVRHRPSRYPTTWNSQCFDSAGKGRFSLATC